MSRAQQSLFLSQRCPWAALSGGDPRDLTKDQATERGPDSLKKLNRAVRCELWMSGGLCSLWSHTAKELRSQRLEGTCGASVFIHSTFFQQFTASCPSSLVYIRHSRSTAETFPD